MVWLYLCLTFPSLPQVHKYLGWGGVAVYLVITAAALRLLKRLGTSRRIAQCITDRQARWLTGMTLLLVLAAFLLRTARVLEALFRGSRIEWAAC